MRISTSRGVDLAITDLLGCEQEIHLAQYPALAKSYVLQQLLLLLLVYEGSSGVNPASHGINRWTAEQNLRSFVFSGKQALGAKRDNLSR